MPVRQPSPGPSLTAVKSACSVDAELEICLHLFASGCFLSRSEEMKCLLNPAYLEHDA